MKRMLGLLAAMVLFAGAGVAHAGAGTGLIVDPGGGGDSAPDFTLEEFGTGKQVTLSQYIGKKVIMLEFWATWCNICKVEMPNLVKEYDEWKGKGYEVFAITLTTGDAGDLEKIKALKEKNKIGYPILLDKQYEVATKLYKLSGPIPLKLVIDCKGKIVYEHIGDFADGVSEIPFVLEQLLADPACQKN